ncbi:MAG: DUF6456 domain-containing protein [Rhodosalinus sp.]
MGKREPGATAAGMPDWLPVAVRHYHQHTEAGLTIRQLARGAGCHASTVMRQIRRMEARRDDPLVDAGLRRLGQRDAGRLPPCIDREAARILRRLAEPGAVLAVAEGMEKAVVVRETPEGTSLRTAVLDAALAQALALKEWIACRKSGRVAQYSITGAGRTALARRAEVAPGLGEAAAAFGHAPAREAPRAPRYGPVESPLRALARRRDAQGRPFLSEALVAAGERLREDFELAQLGEAASQDWDRFLTAGTTGGAPRADAVSGPAAARARLATALGELGPGLGDVALRCCCYLEGLETAEKRMGWSARSGKIVLRIALQRLRRHYDETLGPGGPLIG